MPAQAVPAEEPDRHAHDGLLVGRCLSGDARAWEQLVRRQRPLIVAVARRSGLRGEEVEDAFQSVCVTLLQRLDLLKDHRSLAAWVATTTARKCWRLRASTRTQPLLPPEPASPAPADEFLAASERTAVQDALGRLQDPCATLLRLMFVEEMAYTEVARTLGLAIGSIGVYRRRCLNRLRAELVASGWLRPSDASGRAARD